MRGPNLLINCLLCFACASHAQYSWTLLGKSMPSGFEQREYTQMQYSSAYGAAVICQANTTAPYATGIYSNNCMTCPLNAAGDSIICTNRFQTKWINLNPSGSPRTVPMASNFTGDSTPPDRHAYFVINDTAMLWVSGVNSNIQDTMVFQPGGVNVGTDEITLDGPLKWWSNRDAIVFGTSFGGLTAGTVYWMIRVSPTVIKVATSSANAAAGSAFNINAAPGAATIVYHAFTGYHPQDVWEFPMSGSTWTGTQKHQAGAFSYSRGDGAFGQATEWWPSMNAVFVQHLRNYEASPYYPWLYEPSTNRMIQLTGAGNARNTNEAPQVGGANVMTHSTDDDCMHLFGDADTSINFEPFGNDLFRICKSDTVWQRIPPVTPRPVRRDNHVFEWIPGTPLYLAHGGNTRAITPPTNTPLNDTWLYNKVTNAWDSLEVGTLPAASAQAYGVYLPNRKKMLIQVILPAGAGTNFYTMDIGGSTWGPFGNNDIFRFKLGL